MTNLHRPTPWPSQEWEPKGDLGKPERIQVLRILDAAECSEDDTGERTCVINGDQLEHAMKLILGT